MVNLGKIHRGDIGTELQLLVQDTLVDDTNVPVDLSQVDGVVPLFVIITDPDGTETTFVSNILNPPGTDGFMVYITTTSIWNQAGYWKKRPKLVYLDGRTYQGNDIIFEVL
jgi:hypothetical protein